MCSYDHVGRTDQEEAKSEAALPRPRPLSACLPACHGCLPSFIHWWEMRMLAEASHENINAFAKTELAQGERKERQI